jgi:hypothetical protein
MRTDASSASAAPRRLIQGRGDEQDQIMGGVQSCTEALRNLDTLE